MSIGKNIKKIREANGLTQSELAKKLGVSDKTVSSWEVDRTEPNMGTFEKLSECFNVKKSELMGENAYIDENAFNKLLMSNNKALKELLVKISNLNNEEIEALNKLLK